MCINEKLTEATTQLDQAKARVKELKLVARTVEKLQATLDGLSTEALEVAVEAIGEIYSNYCDKIATTVKDEPTTVQPEVKQEDAEVVAKEKTTKPEATKRQRKDQQITQLWCEVFGLEFEGKASYRDVQSLIINNNVLEKLDKGDQIKIVYLTKPQDLKASGGDWWKNAEDLLWEYLEFKKSPVGNEPSVQPDLPDSGDFKVGDLVNEVSDYSDYPTVYELISFNDKGDGFWTCQSVESGFIEYSYPIRLKKYTPNPITVGLWVNVTRDESKTPYKVLEIDGTVATIQDDPLEATQFYELSELNLIDPPTVPSPKIAVIDTPNYQIDYVNDGLTGFCYKIFCKTSHQYLRKSSAFDLTFETLESAKEYLDQLSVNPVPF